MADPIETLLKKDQIIGVVNDLFIGTDNRDWARVKRCFADKVLFDMTSLAGGSPTSMTPQQIADAWQKGLKDLNAIHHQAGNYAVSIYDHEATVHCYGIAYHYLPNPTNRNTRTFVGSYDFRLREVDQHWSIDQFKFNLKFMDGNPNLEASK